MDASKDYYATLGVLPTAEDIVIRAAYKALAQRYHPDRNAGVKEETHRRMAEINEAYEVLSNLERRKEYDKSRGTNTQSGDSYFGETSGDTPPKFDPLENDWRVAVKYYADLAELEQRLSRISWRLAYSFRAYLLEAKAFDRRTQVAETLQQKFLETYFGTNKEILDFARTLIDQGQKPAAKALNEAIRVLGSRIEAARVIYRIRSEFEIDKPTDIGTTRTDNFRTLARQLRNWGLKESEIAEQLISRGLNRKDAAGLAYMVFNDR